MSDVNSASEAMGVPPELVSRSAAARAAASGTTTEEVLTAWSGGGTVASKPAPAEAPEPAEPEDDQAEDQADEEAEPAAEAPSAPPPAPPAATSEPAVPLAPIPEAARAPGEPPVLVGVEDNPWAVVAGAVILFFAVALLALLGPSIPTDPPGARTSDLPLSEAAEAGQEHYTSLGCASCHTQLIRPVVADVGLGPVTLSDTDQVLGLRRYGPDLSDIGSRMSGTQIESVITGGAGHPSHNLSDEDMSELVAYLLESATSTAGEGEG